MDLATRWSNLFVGMSPASFFNFSFLPKYGVYFLQALGYTLLLAVISVAAGGHSGAAARVHAPEQE